MATVSEKTALPPGYEELLHYFHRGLAAAAGQAVPQPPPAAKGEEAHPAGARAEWERERDRVEVLYLAALKQNPAERRKLEIAWQFAADEAAAGKFPQALKALKVLQEHIGQAAQAAPAGDAAKFGIPAHVVEERKKFLLSRWQQAVAGIGSEVDKLRRALHALGAGEDADQVPDAIQGTLANVCDALNDAVGGAGPASPEQQSPLEAFLKAVRAMKETVRADPLVGALKRARAEVGADVNVEGVLLAALNDIEGRLAG